MADCANSEIDKSLLPVVHCAQSMQKLNLAWDFLAGSRIFPHPSRKAVTRCDDSSVFQNPFASSPYPAFNEIAVDESGDLRNGFSAQSEFSA